MNDDTMRQTLFEEFRQKEVEKLSKRMSEIGSAKSKKKKSAGRRNAAKARAALRKLLKKDPEYLSRQRNGRKSS